ncbi:MAG: GspH/FimT family pseudopilin [Zoogloea sp.]|nr:GspH/FimT family pseudopilin [Zoogloea sp.]
MHKKKFQGFTLVELIVTLAVAAILMGTAVPSFTSLMNSNRLATHANDLLGAVMIARSEAIRLNRRVILCSSSDGATCSSAAGRWSGWLVFVDNNRNDSPDSGEVLRTGTIAPAEVTVQASQRIVDQGNRLRMGADGLARAATGSSAVLLQAKLSVCIATGSVTQNTREIRISAGGQALIVPVDNDGSCPVPSNA